MLLFFFNWSINLQNWFDYTSIILTNLFGYANFTVLDFIKSFNCINIIDLRQLNISGNELRLLYIGTK